MPGQLESIIALQEALTSLSQAEERLNSIPDWMQEIHEEHQVRKQEIDVEVEAADAAGRLRREAEAALADAQEKHKHFQSQISLVSTQREYGALLKEIDTVKEQIAEFEKQALESLEAFEAADAKRVPLTEEFQDLDNRYQEAESKWEKEKPGIATSIKKLKKTVAELREQVQLPYLRLFERLYERGNGQALAPILRIVRTRKKANAFWQCGACNYRVRPQIVVEIRTQGSVTQCDTCQRVLYVLETPEEEA